MPNDTSVLLVQLGTPQSWERHAVYKYLKEFLSDPRIIETNTLSWKIFLHTCILPLRSRSASKQYKEIWGATGSPLMVSTSTLANALSAKLSKFGIEVMYAMRYGEPSIKNKIEGIIKARYRKLIVVPLFPQYSSTTSGSIFDEVTRALRGKRVIPELYFVRSFHAHERYLDTLSGIINNQLTRSHTQIQRLVLSYHGIPKEYSDKGDIYKIHCEETTKLLSLRIKIASEKILHTYQSRFGRAQWLTPYTDKTLEKLAKEGVKHVAVAFPGFAADCLETIYEIGKEGARLFKKHGGERLSLVPCLNADPLWISALGDIILEKLSPSGLIEAKQTVTS